MITIYTKYKAMYLFFDKSKTSKKIEILLYISYYVINSGLYLIFNNPIINLLNNIILLFFMTLNYILTTTRKN